MEGFTPQSAWPFGRPFGKLTVLSKAEGLTVLSKVEGQNVPFK
jgi:hypothetical protein